jgi:hypothetical protein
MGRNMHLRIHKPLGAEHYAPYVDKNVRIEMALYKGQISYGEYAQRKSTSYTMYNSTLSSTNKQFKKEQDAFWAEYLKTEALKKTNCGQSVNSPPSTNQATLEINWTK